MASKSDFPVMLTGAYRRVGTYRILLAIVLIAFFGCYWMSFSPVEQAGLATSLKEKPLKLSTLPEDIRKFLNAQNADGKPLSLRMQDGWGSSGFPVADKISEASISVGGSKWRSLKKGISLISRKDHQKALDVFDDFLPVPETVEPVMSGKHYEPVPSGNRERILYGLVRYHQGIAYLKLADGNCGNPSILNDMLQKAVFTLRLSLNHFENLNNPNSPLCRFDAWSEEDRVWDNNLLPPEFGNFAVRWAYAALGTAYLRSKDLPFNQYPLADTGYSDIQNEKYGNDAGLLASTARGFLDAASEAVGRQTKNDAAKQNAARLWRLSMGFSNVGLCARRLQEDDPLFHYTAGILLSSLAINATNDQLRDRAWKLAQNELVVADGNVPEILSGSDEESEHDVQERAEDETGPETNSEPKEVLADYGNDGGGEVSESDNVSSGGNGQEQWMEQDIALTSVRPEWLLKEQLVTALLCGNDDKTLDFISMLSEPVKISSGGPDGCYGSLAGDLAVATYLARGDFKKADEHVSERKKALRNLPKAGKAFDGFLAVMAQNYLAQVSSLISPGNALGWKEMDSAIATYDWLGSQKAHLKRPSSVFLLFSGRRFWVLPVFIVIIYMALCLHVWIFDRKWARKMLGNTYAADLKSKKAKAMRTRDTFDESKFSLKDDDEEGNERPVDSPNE